MPIARAILVMTAGLALQLAIASVASAAGSVAPNDMARFLAGMEPSAASPLQSFTRHPAWQRYARRLDASWKALESRQLSKVRDWSKFTLPNRRPVVFYAFSGPDFLYADALLPGASTYVLSGLEPVGRIPTLATLQRASLSGELAMIEASLNSVLSYSFFRTREMKGTLASRRLDGTLPLLLLFMARSDKVVTEIELVGLDRDGTVQRYDNRALPNTDPGVKIAFTDADGGEVRTLYYFSTNLDNNGVKSSGFLAFCRTLGPGDSLVKSASYLLHERSFTTVRDFLLDHSVMLVQDDSGIPVEHFDAERWQLQPYGAYLGPIKIFPGRYQSKLKSVFAQGGKPLPFGIGYRWRPQESNLLVATRSGL